jgi:hypothetical protein
MSATPLGQVELLTGAPHPARTQLLEALRSRQVGAISGRSTRPPAIRAASSLTNIDQLEGSNLNS